MHSANRKHTSIMGTLHDLRVLVWGEAPDTPEERKVGLSFSFLCFTQNILCGISAQIDLAVLLT